jgi:hypothetical protein
MMVPMTTAVAWLAPRSRERVGWVPVRVAEFSMEQKGYPKIEIATQPVE